MANTARVPRKRVTVTLDQEVYEQLERDADEAVRTSEQHAAYLIKQALRSTAVPPRTTVTV